MVEEKNIKTNKILCQIYKDLESIYTMTEIEQEVLHSCYENDKDCFHVTFLIDIILEKFQKALSDFKNCTKF